MGRALTSLIIIAAVLACPYACHAGLDCCGEADPMIVPPCCERCANTSDAPLHSLPPSPTDEPCSSCCLCHGAILGNALLDFRPLTESLLALPPMAIRRIVPQSPELSACFAAASEPFGNGLRIAIGSLLC